MARKIVDCIAPQTDDVMLEIGPGMGMLTRYVQPTAKHLFAVEIDQRLYGSLLDQFADAKNFTLVKGDFLKIDISEPAKNQTIRIFGNIPYNITSPILFKCIENRSRIKDLTLLVQKEVGRRIVSKPNSKDYGILAVLSQAAADVDLLLKTPPTVFQPRPAVDSALVQWRFTDVRSRHIENEQFFKNLVKQAFGKRRKMLRNSLKEFADKTSFDFSRRPEQLSVEEWIELANELAPTGQTEI